MKTFLDQMAQELLKDGKTDFSSTCIVLPNRRAGVFFRNALAKYGDKAIWAPTVRSIEDFIFELAGAVKVDRTTLLFTFYEVYRKQISNPQSLDVFANWASTFLADVNEVDLNLIDAADIYRQLHSVERIERWNPQQTEPTEFQRKHLDRVAQMGGLYSALRKKLEANNLAYQGMAFRKVAENVERIIEETEYENVWFAGFNALTVSEERIIQSWLGSGYCRVFWDMDSFYADDPIHEAGHYIRRFRSGKAELKLDENYNWRGNAFSENEKEVHLIGVQRNVAQAQVAASVLRSKIGKDPENSFTKTAIVLNDDKLLIPLLHSLPEELQGVNITMGYGLRNSQSATFINKLFALYERFAENRNRFYHVDVLAVLNDGFYRTLPHGQKNDLQEQIIRKKRIYLPVKELATSSLNRVLFNDSMYSVSGFLNGLKRILTVLHEGLQEKDEMQIEMEFLFLFSKQLQRLSDLVEEFGGIESIKTLHTFWCQFIRIEKLDFVGEPLSGLQILGMLETRNLDFEEVIILGVNEGNLPSNTHKPSYFTFDVRRTYGLPCQNERDAVTAYHFYRLLQRAKKVYLIYDQDTDSLGSGEVSRYVRQLQAEKSENIRFREWNVEQEIPGRPLAAELNIEKGDLEFDRLHAYGRNGFSPSALNTFRSCPLKFYFRYVAGYGEQQELKESIDHATFGTAVHNTLEKLYRPYLGKPLSEIILKELLKLSTDVLNSEFRSELAIDGDLAGRNLLAYEVGILYVKRVIDHDIGSIRSGESITPLQLEQKLEGELKLKIDGAEETIKVKGMADRIDRLSDGTIRLIDYKTGSFDKKNSIKKVEDLDSPKTDHAFQLLLYSLMFGQENPEMQKIRPTVFYLRSKNVEHPISVSEEKIELKDSELLEYAMDRLTDVLQELFDRNVAFSQTGNLQTCTYCDFNQICQR